MLSLSSLTGETAEDLEIEEILDGLHRLWRLSPPADLAAYVRSLGDAATPYVLGLLAKTDLQYRHDRGEDARAREYLDRFSVLESDRERALSLIYEEYCLHEEANRRPDPDEFCDRYPTWADSLASQLNYHKALSMVSGREVRTQFPRPGERFSKYSLDSVLGQGGSARVFLAHDDDLGGRKFVLKVSPDRGSEPSILGKLSHRNIIPVHSVEIEPVSGLRGLRMPYYPGPPLDVVAAKIRAGKPLRTARELFDLIKAESGDPNIDTSGWAEYPHGGSFQQGVAWIGLRLADALAYSHANGTLHRDVKPANVLLSIEHGPQLLDFNLAQAPNSAEEAEVALRGGTLPYMSPEQLRAFQDPDKWDELGPTSDIYSLGLVLSELLTGKSLERRESRVPLPRAIQNAIDDRAAPRLPLHKRYPRIPQRLSLAVGKCLEHSPGDRFQSADELMAELGRVLVRKNRAPVVVPGAAVLLLAGVWAGPRVLEGATVFRGENAYSQGRFAEALDLLLPVLEKRPSRVDLLVHCAYASEKVGALFRANQYYREASDDPRSIPVLQELTSRDDKSLSARMSLGQAYFKQKQFAAAEAEFLTLLKLAPQMSSAHQALHVLHFEQGAWTKALADLDAMTRIQLNNGLESERAVVEFSRIALERMRVVEKMGDTASVELLNDLIARNHRFNTVFERNPRLLDVARREHGLLALHRAVHRRRAGDVQGADSDLDLAWSLRDEGTRVEKDSTALSTHFKKGLESPLSSR